MHGLCSIYILDFHINSEMLIISRFSCILTLQFPIVSLQFPIHHYVNNEPKLCKKKYDITVWDVSLMCSYFIEHSDSHFSCIPTHHQLPIHPHRSNELKLCGGQHHCLFGCPKMCLMHSFLTSHLGNSLVPQHVISFFIPVLKMSQSYVERNVFHLIWGPLYQINVSPLWARALFFSPSSVPASHRVQCHPPSLTPPSSTPSSLTSEGGHSDRGPLSR